MMPGGSEGLACFGLLIADRKRMMDVTDADLLGLTPGGRVVCVDPQSPLSAVFAESEAAGLARLAGRKAATEAADATLLFWRSIAEEFLRAICHLPEGADAAPCVPPPEPARLTEWILNAPPMRGAEYLSAAVLEGVWNRLLAWTQERVVELGGVAGFLEEHAPLWSRVGKVTVHLAENKSDDTRSFAFMASRGGGAVRGRAGTPAASPDRKGIQRH